MSYFYTYPGSSSAGGDVVGPASSTDNAVARFDGTTGKLLRNSVVIISDAGAVTGVTTLVASSSLTATSLNLTANSNQIILDSDDGSGFTTTITDSATAARVLTLPDATDTLVGKATTDTLTNKTLTSPVLNTSATGTAVLDDDTFATASATTLATSESIKAYVLSQVGGASSSFDATVGATGADYTTIELALAATKSRLLVIDDVTTAGACAVPSTGLYIYIEKGKNVNMGANQFTFAGNYNLTIEGQENDSSKITFAFTAATNTELIDTGANTSSVVTLRNLTIDNNSTQSGCTVILNTSIHVVENIWYEPPNVANCGFYFNNAQSRGQNIWVATPGTTATDVVRVDAGIVRNLRLSGAFTNSNDVVTVGGDQAMIDGVSNSGNVKIAVTGGKLMNVMQGGGTFNIDVDGNDQAQFSNVFLSTGTVTISGSADKNRFVNCEIPTLTLTATNVENQFNNCEITAALTVNDNRSQFSNSLFSGAVTIVGDYNTFSNCRLASTLTVNSGAVRNIFTGCNVVGGVTINDQTIMIGCKVGADAGGGAATITVSAGTDTVLTGNITDAAISDSGTTTQMSNNVIY